MPRAPLLVRCQASHCREGGGESHVLSSRDAASNRPSSSGRVEYSSEKEAEQKRGWGGGWRVEAQSQEKPLEFGNGATGRQEAGSCG